MADDPTLGAVVVGTGFGVLTHLRAMRAAGFDVRSLVGRDATKAKERAALFGVPHSTDDLTEALSLEGVDVVAVATPPHTHAPITLAAVAAGKHVLCEKPFARDLEEARAMLRAAEDEDVVHMLGTEFRFGTGQATLTRTVRSGVIGQPQFALFQLQMPSLVDPGAGLPAWWEQRSEGGGWLGAYGSHVVDQVRVTLGEFDRLSATLQRLAPRPAMTADDTYTVHFELDNGCQGILHSSCAAGGQFVATTKIIGTAGTVWQEGEEVFVDTGDGPRQVPLPEDLPLVAPDAPPAELLHTTYDMWHSMGIDLAPYTRVYDAMRDRILGRSGTGDPAAATFVDGVACQAVLDAIHLSSEERRWVTVDRTS